MIPRRSISNGWCGRIEPGANHVVVDQLREAGLVATRGESRTIFYRSANEKARQLVSTLLRSFGGTPRVTPSARRRPHRRTTPAAVFAVVRAVECVPASLQAPAEAKGQR
jgi:DNA-binding transcriptional ArsR family regulator